MSSLLLETEFGYREISVEVGVELLTENQRLLSPEQARHSSTLGRVWLGSTEAVVARSLVLEPAPRLQTTLCLGPLTSQ